MRITSRSGAAISGETGLVTALKTTFVHALPLIIASVVLMTCGFLFDALTVQVSRSDIMIKFGIGIIRRRFAVVNVQLRP